MPGAGRDTRKEDETRDGGGRALAVAAATAHGPGGDAVAGDCGETHTMGSQNASPQYQLWFCQIGAWRLFTVDVHLPM
jgi:hypothetical protein